MKKNNKTKILQNISLISHIGITMIIIIGGGILFGNFLDKKLGTKGIFLAIFTIISVISAFMNLYKITTQGLDNKRK